VAIITWLLKRRRRDVWRELARRHGLTFAERLDGPRVTGQTDGRRVDVFINDASSDRDVGGVEVVRIAVAVRGVPRGMTAEGVPGLIGDLALLAENRIEFQPEDFNRDVLVKGDEAEARSYWNERRKQAFLGLVRTAPCDQIVLREGTLAAELREIVSDRSQLEQLMHQLHHSASVLEESAAETGA
jgi:hypothetical protein